MDLQLWRGRFHHRDFGINDFFSVSRLFTCRDGGGLLQGSSRGALEVQKRRYRGINSPFITF